MKNKAIHQNLDTSFVNLPALVRYLQNRQVVGVITVQFNGYRADIELKENKNLKVTASDQISGIASEGRNGLKQIFKRAQSPGGAISIYQNSIASKSTNGNVKQHIVLVGRH